MSEPVQLTPEEKVQRIEVLRAEIDGLQTSLRETVDAALENLPDRIREHRNRVGLTQQQVAEKIGVSRVQVLNIELALSGLTLRRFVYLCVVFGVSADELIGLSREVRR